MAKQELTPQEFNERMAQSQAAPVGEHTPSQEQDAQKKDYKPTAWVINRIKGIPQNVKEEVKAIYGLDFDDMLAHPENYGFYIMSNVAGNNSTFYPSTLLVDQKMRMAKEMADASNIPLQEAQSRLDWCPDLGKRPILCNYRFWHLPSGKWGMEIHEVNRQQIGKQPLTKEQSERLAMTGTLGEPFMKKNHLGEEIPVLAYLDEYTGAATYRTVKDAEGRFNAKMGERNTFKMDDENGAQKEFRLDDSAKRAAAAGAFVWATSVDDPSVKVNVWYDPRTSKFMPTIKSDPHIGLDEAMRRRAKEAKGQKKSEGKTPAPKTVKKGK